MLSFVILEKREVPEKENTNAKAQLIEICWHFVSDIRKN